MIISRGGDAVTDEQLVFVIVNWNSDAAKDKLIRRYYDHIYAFAYRKLGSVDDACDATQDIFIKAINALPTFDNRRAAFKTWLYAIASNHLRDCHKLRHITEELPEELPDETRFEDIVELRGLAEQIMHWLEKTEPNAYKIVELKIFFGMTFEEIGQTLDIPPNTAKTRYYAAVKHCRKEFETFHDGN